MKKILSTLSIIILLTSCRTNLSNPILIKTYKDDKVVINITLNSFEIDGKERYYYGKMKLANISSQNISFWGRDWGNKFSSIEKSKIEIFLQDEKNEYAVGIDYGSWLSNFAMMDVDHERIIRPEEINEYQIFSSINDNQINWDKVYISIKPYQPLIFKNSSKKIPNFTLEK